MMNRRTFVGTCSTVATAAGLGLGGWLVGRRRLAASELADAGIADLKGAAVSLTTPAGRTVTAVLEDVRVTRHGRRPGAPGTEQISLLLAVDRHAPTAGLHSVRTGDFDLGELYMSPVGPEGKSRRLEAVITRIV